MKPGRQEESGSFTVQTAAIILCCSLIGIAAMSFLAFSNRSLSRGQRDAERSRVRSSLISAIEAALDEIENDASPESDSPLDAAYSISELEGASISIRDESSAINPNWARKGILEDTPLSGLLRPGVGPADLQQFREDSGLSQDIARYAHFFGEGNAQKSLSVYSYANVNSSDEFALRRLCLDATGDPNAAEVFHHAVQAQLKAGKILDEAGLRDLLGIQYGILSTVVTNQAQMNANFLPEKILKALVSYSAWEIPEAGEKWQAIALARESAALSREKLFDILDLKTDHPISGYLGVMTWFWRIRASSGNACLEAIAARRLPYDPSNSGKGLALVSVKEIAP